MTTSTFAPPALTESEQFLMTHISRWGSDGYPINKLAKGWTWGPVREIKGPPIVFKTKREAVSSFEAYMDVLRDKHAAFRQAQALAEYQFGR